MTLDVGNDTTERGLSTNIALLRRVDQHISRRNHDLIIVLRITEVLINVLKVFHMLVSGISWLSNVLRGLEGFFVAIVDLSLSVLFPDYPERCLFEGVLNTDIVVALAEEHAVDLAPLNRIGADVGRVTCNFLVIRI